MCTNKNKNREFLRTTATFHKRYVSVCTCVCKLCKHWDVVLVHYVYHRASSGVIERHLRLSSSLLSSLSTHALYILYSTIIVIYMLWKYIVVYILLNYERDIWIWVIWYTYLSGWLLTYVFVWHVACAAEARPSHAIRWSEAQLHGCMRTTESTSAQYLQSQRVHVYWMRATPWLLYIYNIFI